MLRKMIDFDFDQYVFEYLLLLIMKWSIKNESSDFMGTEFENNDNWKNSFFFFLNKSK